MFSRSDIVTKECSEFGGRGRSSDGAIMLEIPSRLSGKKSNRRVMSEGHSPASGVSPIFMFGFERSGTTLLSMMIGAHPDIAVPLTVTGMWYRYHANMDRYHGLASGHDLERLVDDLLSEERIALWDVELDRAELLEGLEPGCFASVVERFHRVYARHKNKPVWGNLDIATLDEMDVANRWFPSARFLHIVRDGRDVALSHRTMPYGSGNILETSEKWTHRLRVNLKMGAILGSERYQVVRYEDLIVDTEASLRRICDFFCVGYSAKMLDYPGMVGEKVPEDRRWLWPELASPPDSSKVYRWKRKMSRTKRIVFEGVSQRMLMSLGYETYDRVPKRIGALAYELWCGAVRGARIKRLLAKVGIKRQTLLERRRGRDVGRSPVNSANGNKRSPAAPGAEPGSVNELAASQQRAFGALVRDGAYDTKFEHGRAARVFFQESLDYVYDQVDVEHGAKILDCGCGPGAWMDFVSNFVPPEHEVQLFGFDLTPEMVEVARKRLAGRVPKEHLRAGDVLDDSSYTFGEAGRRFDIIYAYDVVQQLPRKKQRDACFAILGRLAPNGFALIFDHERFSKHGYRMGFRKFVTKYLRVPLVPRYYCNASYPALERLASDIMSTGQFIAEVRAGRGTAKRALIVHSLGR